MFKRQTLLWGRKTVIQFEHVNDAIVSEVKKIGLRDFEIVGSSIE